MGDAPLPKEHLLLTHFDELPPAMLEEIARKFPEGELTFYLMKRGSEIPRELVQKATILVTLFDLPRIEDAKHLKFVHSLSAGIDHLVNHPFVKNTNIPITTSSGIHGPPMAEWTVMNWLVASRKYIQTYEAQKEHRWDGVRSHMMGIHDQVGKQVGILGYGSIGRQIARVASALGMTVHAYTASPRTTPSSRRDTGYVVPGTGDPDGSIPASWHNGRGKAALHSFLSIGLDHLVISLPLTPETTHMLGAEEFAILSASSTRGLKPYVTNISRGKVIDQDALIAALKSGELSGAALDVADPEPLPPNNPLWDAPNVQISPHVSSLGVEYFPRVFDIVRLNLDRMGRGEDLVNEYKRGRTY